MGLEFAFLLLVGINWISKKKSTGEQAAHQFVEGVMLPILSARQAPP
jgi:hypothetical protein